MGDCRSKCEVYEPDRSRPTSSTALKQVPEQGSYDSDGGSSSFDLVLQSIVDRGEASPQAASRRRGKMQPNQNPEKRDQLDAPRPRSSASP
jgi:hypothetical protein